MERLFLEPLPLASKYQTFEYAVYDIETDPEDVTKFIMIGFFDGLHYSCFRTLDDFFDEVLRPKYATYRIFAHFGGRFDVHYIFDHLREKMPTAPFEFYCAGSAVISFTLYNEKLWWRFSDSYRLMPSSLYQLTHEFDVEHKKLPFAPTSWEYNRHDCLGLYEVLTKLFDAHGICSETIAAHSMRVFRTHYMERSILIPHLDLESDIRKCYFGGRTEVYRYDKAEVNSYDVNSLFPRAMCDPVPVEYISRTRRLPDDDRVIGFYEADVELPEVYVPALPMRLEKLYFPIGDLRKGHFSSMELRQAISDGAAVRIYSGITFLAEPFLKEFILELHKLKTKAHEDGDAAKEYIYKLIMNSNYGKWGQNRRRRAFCFDTGETHHKSGAELWPLENAPGLAWYVTESQSPHILPHISATITARARMFQLKYLRAPLKNNGHIWYTDTDSLFTDRKIRAGEGLGEMSFKGAGVFQAFGLKEYSWKDQHKIKGLPLRRKDLATGKVIYDKDMAERYRRGEEIKLQRMAGFMESVRRGLPTVRQVEVTRKVREPRPKRARDGVDTRPWNMRELLA